MPSPVAHSMMGLAVYITSTKKEEIISSWKRFLFFIFLANLPDIDFLPVFIFGFSIIPNIHQGITHTIGFSIVAGLFFALLYGSKGGNVLKGFLLVFSLLSSHIFLDYLTVDSTPPYGFKLLWPFSDKPLTSSVSIFDGLAKKSLEELLSYGNFRVVLREMAIFLPLTFLIYLLKMEKESK